MDIVDVILPEITLDDILKYSGAGMHDAVIRKVDEEPYRMSDVEHCLAMFLYELDMQLVGNNGDRNYCLNDILKGKSPEYQKAYIQGRLDELCRQYISSYKIEEIINAGKKQNQVVLRNGFSDDKEIYILQYLLKINGFKIDTDLMIKDYKQTKHETVPVVFTGEFADQEKLKKSMDRNNVRGISSVSITMPSIAERNF